MKRSVSLILLTAVCVLALAAVSTLSGCTVRPQPSDPTGNVDTPDPQPAITGETAEYTSGYVDITMTIPEGWQWESVQDKSMNTEGIRFRKTDDKAVSFELLCWRNGYGICGTGVTSEELTLSGGQMVWQHTEENNGNLWLNLSFEKTPGDYVCAPVGTLTKETWDSCRDEVLAILGTAQFGRDAMTEQEAIDVAKTQYDGPYDETYGHYDIKTGVWSVTFVEGQRPTASIDIKPDGTAGPLALIDSAAKK